jgi:hypothetical protein
LVAGVTLASCASSQTPLPASGPFGQPIGFPGGSARVQFVEGSPNLNLTVNNTDLYIDNKLAITNFAYPYAPVYVPTPSGPVVPVTPYIELPVGPHDIKLVQHGTLQPAFLDQIVTVASGQKITVVAEGDAAYHTTTFGIFTMPVYQTPVGIRATSVLNASPNAGSIDFWYSCPAPALCGDGTNLGTAIGTGITVGTPAKVTTSWKTNVLLKSSTTGSFCLGAYPAGLAAIIPEVNAAAGPPNAVVPTLFSVTADDPRNAACLTAGANDSLPISPGTDTNFFVVDAPSVAPRVPAHGPSAVIVVPDQNG